MVVKKPGIMSEIYLTLLVIGLFLALLTYFDIITPLGQENDNNLQNFLVSGNIILTESNHSLVLNQGYNLTSPLVYKTDSPYSTSGSIIYLTHPEHALTRETENTIITKRTCEIGLERYNFQDGDIFVISQYIPAQTIYPNRDAFGISENEYIEYRYLFKGIPQGDYTLVFDCIYTNLGKQKTLHDSIEVMLE